jgi:hypothetical protein
LIIAKTTGFQAMSNQSNGNIIQLEDGWNNVIKKGVSSVRLRLRGSTVILSSILNSHCFLIVWPSASIFN